jgi:beta-phosphoglucomutase-like phosphatase (HAD superfamily)
MAGVPIPDVFVTAEDVTQGKPLYFIFIFIIFSPPIDLAASRRPDPYLLGAKKCNVDPKRCLFLLVDFPF